MPAIRSALPCSAFAATDTIAPSATAMPTSRAHPVGSSACAKSSCFGIVVPSCPRSLSRYGMHTIRYAEREDDRKTRRLLHLPLKGGGRSAKRTGWGSLRAVASNRPDHATRLLYKDDPHPPPPAQGRGRRPPPFRGSKRHARCPGFCAPRE